MIGDAHQAAGSSPRRRGAPRGRCGHLLTPRDHPRAGGEHCGNEVRSPLFGGSSPRRRGAHGAEAVLGSEQGIIPAQAGSTERPRGPPRRRPDHPRAGGEHPAMLRTRFSTSGSSPRRRGARGGISGAADPEGIIPAQAGSTSLEREVRCRSWDHPRAGGEHCSSRRERHSSQGSSPRRRGALARLATAAAVLGIIPAQAGSTSIPPHPPRSPRDHPRAGGEHAEHRDIGASEVGSSPRRRGAPRPLLDELAGGGIIPAQAGSTLSNSLVMSSTRDHPRAGGEHRSWRGPVPVREGSSPRRRGAPSPLPARRERNGIIPAQAGSTTA